MKTIQSKIERYTCEYCDCTHPDSNWMQNHEADHAKVELLEVGQLVTYNFDRGYTRIGKVIKKDVVNTRFLVEAANEERDWTSFYNAKLREERI